MIGDRLGLYRALWETMPATPAEVAARSESGCTLAITGEADEVIAAAAAHAGHVTAINDLAGHRVPPRAGASVDNAMHGG